MEMIFNIVLGIFLVLYMVLSFSLDKNSVAGDVFGAGGFPIVLAVLGLIVLAFIIWNGLKHKTKVHIPMFDIQSSSGKALVLNVILLTAYLLVMDVIGFILSTLIFTFTSARAMGYNKLRALLMFSIILSAAIVLVFGNVFFVPLPRGMGMLRELSYLIY